MTDSVKVDGQVKVPTVATMRLHGKRVMELSDSLPHTRAEMTANAPKGVVKIGGSALVNSIKNSTQAKLNSWDNMPVPDKDVFEEAAKKMSSIALKKLLKTYFVDDHARYLLVSKLPKGDSCEVANTLLHEVVLYWKANYSSPPDVDVPVANDYDPNMKEAMKMSVLELREYLIEVFAGDADKCNIIKKAPKGKFSSPDSLVSIFVEAKVARATSSL